MTWRIEEFTVTAEQAKRDKLGGVLNNTGRYVPPGKYRRLMNGNILVMSDTPDEIADLREFEKHAIGSVLINGQGLGIAVRMALAKPDVTSVKVIEIDPEVIALAAIKDERLTIECADALAWKPPKLARWNVVWHDIWNFISADNLSDMRRLHRKYAKRTDWQGSWCRHQCERANRDLRRWR